MEPATLTCLPGAQWPFRPQAMSEDVTGPPPAQAPAKSSSSRWGPSAAPFLQQGALIPGQIHRKHIPCPLHPGPLCQVHSTPRALGSSPTTPGSLPESSQTLPMRQRNVLRNRDAGKTERNQSTPKYNVRVSLSLSPNPGGISCG